MVPLNHWPFWKRALLTNACAVVGVCLAFALPETAKPSMNIRVGIAVFTIAAVNLMMLAVSPRIGALKTAGGAAPSPWRVAYDVLAERPLITALLILSSWEYLKPLRQRLS